MTEITLKLRDEVIKDYGELFIKNFIEKQVEYLSLFRAMDKIEEQINASGMDYDKELDSVREKAWKDYKKDFAKIVLLEDIINKIERTVS